MRDVDAALAFYTSVFGMTVHEVNLGTDDAPLLYRELQVDGRTVAGVTQMTDDWPSEIPSHWTVVFAVADADAAAVDAERQGGIVHVAPMDIPPGRYSVITDPSGAAFSIIQLK